MRARSLLHQKVIRGSSRSGDGPRPLVESRIAEASTLPDLRTVFERRFRYYNRKRKHSSIGYVPPREHLT
ncbi:integrase core domain-containing protein [Salinibacter ruber]|uniref:integrase core domain-containing protein n=1 Tax=Salinibacter ruber TaxID=146919 RepID=UPI003C6DC712